jgi:hypothetical protein
MDLHPYDTKRHDITRHDIVFLFKDLSILLFMLLFVDTLPRFHSTNNSYLESFIANEIYIGGQVGKLNKSIMFVGFLLLSHGFVLLESNFHNYDEPMNGELVMLRP